MTENKALKAAIRQRMAETGEPYSVARHAVQAGQPAAPAYVSGPERDEPVPDEDWDKRYYVEGAATEGMTVEAFKAMKAPDLARKRADEAQEQADQAHDRVGEARDEADEARDERDREAQSWAERNVATALREADQAEREAERAEREAERAQELADLEQERADLEQERADELAEEGYHRSQHRGSRPLPPGADPGLRLPWWFPGRSERQQAMPPFPTPPATPHPLRPPR